MKLTVLTPDLSHNCLSRARLLARLAARRFDVEIVGPARGEGVWTPLQSADVEIKGVHRQPRGLDALRSVSELLRRIDGDVVYASKPVPGSFGVGLLQRVRSSTPLVLDIDDRDLCFRSPANSRVAGYLFDLQNAASLEASYYARLMESLVGLADARTVTTPALRRRFGGTVVPQVCDTDVFDPARYDRERCRATLGLPQEAVIVLFPGKPLAHKGTDDLAAALASLDRDDVEGVVVGDPSAESSGQPLSVYGPTPLSEMPRWFAAADIVAVPQKQREAAEYQFPIKLVNAMAMARPVVTTSVSNLPAAVEGCGRVVEPGAPSQLADAIEELAAAPALRESLGAAGRTRCLEQYSVDAQAPAVNDLLDRVVASSGHERGAPSATT